MAGPTFNGTAISLIGHHVRPSTPLITIPQPLFPSALKLPSKRPRIDFHVVVPGFCRYQFSSFPVGQCRPSDLLPDDVLCRRVSRSCRCSRSVWLLLSSTMNARIFVSNCLFVHCSLGKLTINPFARHITVSTQLHCGSCFARMQCLRDPDPWVSFFLNLFSSPFFSVFLCSVGSSILFRM